MLVSSLDTKPIFEPVEWLYHRDSEAEADFITVITNSQRKLRLSGNHLIPHVPCQQRPLTASELDHYTNVQSVFARRLTLGQCVAILVDNEFVTDQVVRVVQERKRGIYSPITSRGTIVVNDVHVSCYSSFENHLAQKAVHTTLIEGRRLISSMWNAIFGSGLAPEDSQVPMPLQVFLRMAQLVAPSSVYRAY